MAYRRYESLLQFPRLPSDAISPSKMQIGLKDRIELGKGAGAVAAVAAHLAKSRILTPWTLGGKGVAKGTAQATRAAASQLTRGASEIAQGIGGTVKKFKFW